LNLRPPVRLPVSSSRVTQSAYAEPVPKASVGQLHIFHKGRDSIAGTFYIDPKVPSFGFDPKGCKARKKNPPHASFRTRNGAISLDLASTGDVNPASKAEVLVGSRSGKITINLLPMPATRPRIALEAFTRRGDIVLFLPDTFSGVIQLSTRRGSLEFLPGLAAIMKVIKRSDKDALVSVGDYTMSGDTKHVDFCQLTSRSGNLIVGLSRKDRHVEVTSGFWATLFCSGKST